MALPNDVESTQDLLRSQSHVINHIFNYTNSMSLLCAIQLGIPDAIHNHGKPMSLSQLADALSINKAKSSNLSRLIRLLVHSKFFEKVKISGDGDGAYYGLTGASRLLVRGGPTSMVPFALDMLDPVKIDTWHHMSEWFKNNDPSPFVTKHGMSIFYYDVSNQRINSLFNEAMASDAGFFTTIVGKECRQVFEGLTSMVDVGGGTGETARGIAATFPGLRCVVLDLPRVVSGLEGSENVSFVSGDMFELIPHADAVFLKWILHNWSDEDCVKILGKCKEAIQPSGKVIIVEIVVNDDEKQADYDDKETETQLFFDLQMMALMNSEERSEKQWSKLFYAAGFNHFKITPISGFRSVIELFP